MRISGFSSVLSAIAVFLDPPIKVLKNAVIAEKKENVNKVLGAGGWWEWGS